jgi:hypothetical protein
VQKSAGKFLASIFWDQDGILPIDYLPKGQAINVKYYSSLLVQLKNILKEKRRGISPRWYCYCTTMPRLTGHLLPRRNWPTYASSILITPPSLRIGLPPVPWTEKTIEISPCFVRCGVMSAADTWLDGQYSDFFSGLQKLEQRAKKCIEFRGDFIE